MPSNRPAIPIETKREVLFEARHHCAVCCESLPLEYAHIVPWGKTRDHSAENLIALCANCHSRADKEDWGVLYLKRYKDKPCILERSTLPPMSVEQKMMVDLILAAPPDSMTPMQSMLLRSAIAAYTGTTIEHVEVLALEPFNSSRMRISLPEEAAKRLLRGFDTNDSLLRVFLENVDVLNIDLAHAESGAIKTDTSEAGLETTIVNAMLVRGWIQSLSSDYNREYAVDLVQLRVFLEATQPTVLDHISLDPDDPAGRQFLARLQGEITKRGVIDVLRNGLSHGRVNDVRLFYGTPSEGNLTAQAHYAANRFSVTRQLRYSRDETMLALDLCLFINGLPVATFELKNSLTKQTVEDAVQQYKRDRSSRELLFQFGRCVVHFAVDDAEVRMCTELKDAKSWFLPFNKGWNDGAGNPPNPYGIKTDYLWKQILTPDSLTNILEYFAQVVEKKDEKTGKKRKQQVFPRYHQLDVVRTLLADVRQRGVGRRYLIQHSAGSGKSNSIAWLAHQLVGVERDHAPVFDSIIVITDRVILDQQISATIRQFAQVGALFGRSDSSSELKQYLESGKKIISTTIQKFPFILEEIGSVQRGRRFAIIIDEAHSSQGGRTSAAVSMALSEAGEAEEEETTEDIVNRIMASRKMLDNASYFAFTATPKNKTLEIFGEPYPEAGVVKHRPFHSYTMKQAIQERFILDVLQHYTPIDSYYRLTKTVEGDPEFDAKKAQRKLRRYVEGHDHAIRIKAEIMVDHFHEQVIAQNKIGGQARAMVVTAGIQRAIQYYHAIRAYLQERKSRHQAIVAFSGEHEYDGRKVTEATLNGFPSSQIADQIQQDPYRFLVVADKFQTGYDEPLLHTMYVDKPLSGIKAVQTLSRLNRAHPQKHDVFVLDFMNDSDTIQLAFSDYYRTTILSQETDPNKLHDLKADLDGYQVYNNEQIEQIVSLYLGGADRERLDPILDACVVMYQTYLDEDGQVDFKGKAKGFVRTYNFLASVLPYNNASWEKLSIFLNFLVPKLPAPQEEDLTRGILETIDIDSYRAEKRATMKIILEDTNAEIEPVPTSTGGFRPEPEVDHLSNIIRTFNDTFGNIDWTDADRVRHLITVEIPARVAADAAYRNASQRSDAQNARIEHDKALDRVMTSIIKDDTELYKQFSDNPDFKRWLTEEVHRMVTR
jgi:type I restriction enzyme, R subunit